MPWDEIRNLNERLTGLRVAVEGMRKDVAYLSQFYIPLVLLGLVALLVGLIGLYIATDNRALLLEHQRDVVQQLEKLPAEGK